MQALSTLDFYALISSSLFFYYIAILNSTIGPLASYKYAFQVVFFHCGFIFLKDLTGVTRDVAESYLLLSVYGCKTEAAKSDEEVLRHIAAATGKSLVGERERDTGRMYFKFSLCRLSQQLS